MRHEISDSIKIGISRYGSAQNTNWEEGKHPRADDGKFGKGGGSGAGGDDEPKEPMTSPLKKEADQEKVKPAGSPAPDKNVVEAGDAISFLIEGNAKPGDKKADAAITKVQELMARVEGRHEEPARPGDADELKKAVLEACDVMEANAKKDRFSGDLIKHVQSVRAQVAGSPALKKGENENKDPN